MKTQFSVNTITLLGNVTTEPEVKTTKTGTLIMKFGMATSHSIKNGDEYEQKTTFHNIVAVGKGAEYLQNKIYKGSKLLVIGRQEHNSYEAQDGSKKYYSSVVVETITPLSDLQKDQTSFTKNEDIEIPF